MRCASVERHPIAQETWFCYISNRKNMGNTDVSAKSQQQIHQHCKRKEEQMSAFHCWRSIFKDTLEPDHSRISFDNLTQTRSFLGSEFSVASYNPCLIRAQQAFPF